MNDNLKDIDDEQLQLIIDEIKASPANTHEMIFPFAHQGNTSIEALEEAINGMKFAIFKMKVKYQDNLIVRLGNIPQLESQCIRIIVNSSCYDQPEEPQQ